MDEASSQQLTAGHLYGGADVPRTPLIPDALAALSPADHLIADKRAVITALETRLEAEFRGEESGHDWLHLDRVRNAAVTIAKNTEGADPFVVEVAALLHDYKDDKIKGNEERPSVRQVLGELGVDEADIEQVAAITESVGFRKRHEVGQKSLEGQIVEDADRQDAIGAIGIARVFAFGGSREEPVVKAIDHFYEKLLLLKDLMNTPAAKKMAEGRHAFMLAFLTQYHKEGNEMSLAGQQLAGEEAHTLDTMGAAGIIQIFADGGHEGIPVDASVNRLRANLLVSPQAYSKIGISMAEGRHAYMVAFLEQFDKETQGKS